MVNAEAEGHPHTMINECLAINKTFMPSLKDSENIAERTRRNVLAGR